MHYCIEHLRFTIDGKPVCELCNKLIPDEQFAALLLI